MVKGDIKTKKGTGANTTEILPIGTDDFVLTSDSSLLCGMGWKTPKVGCFPLQLVSQQFVGGTLNDVVFTGITEGTNVISINDITSNTVFTGIDHSFSCLGKSLILCNFDSNSRITLKHEDVGSLAGNRFHCYNQSDVILLDGGSIVVTYIENKSRWMVGFTPQI